MDVNKFYEFFQPEKVKSTIHIIGCGAVGSTLAELLVRMGIKKFKLYDFDIVEPHNIANQLYRDIDIGKKKTDALAEIMREINPDVEISTCERYDDQVLNGYVFMAVDKVSIRKKIFENNKLNVGVKAIFDVRIRLTDAQGYAARVNNYAEMKNMENSLAFTDEEADAETPVSACNMTLSVAPTVRIICNYMIANFMNLFINDENFKRVFIVDAFNYHLEVY